jgi:hypothetical protein
MTKGQKIKEIIGGIFFCLSFLGLIAMTSFTQQIEQTIIEQGE